MTFKNESISVILPAYNEEDNIEEAVNNVHQALKWIGMKYEIIIETNSPGQSFLVLSDPFYP